MFNPVLFELCGVLLGDEYLLGQYRWTDPVRLTEAHLVCQPPTAGTLVLALEIAGGLSGDVFTIPTGVAEVRQTLPLDRLVNAGDFVRWKISSFDEADAHAATRASITVTVTES